MYITVLATRVVKNVYQRALYNCFIDICYPKHRDYVGVRLDVKFTIETCCQTRFKNSQLLRLVLFELLDVITVKFVEWRTFTLVFFCIVVILPCVYIDYWIRIIVKHKFFIDDIFSELWFCSFYLPRQIWFLFLTEISELILICLFFSFIK